MCCTLHTRPKRIDSFAPMTAMCDNLWYLHDSEKGGFLLCGKIPFKETVTEEIRK